MAKKDLRCLVKGDIFYVGIDPTALTVSPIGGNHNRIRRTTGKAEGVQSPDSTERREASSTSPQRITVAEATEPAHKRRDSTARRRSRSAPEARRGSEPHKTRTADSTGQREGNHGHDRREPGDGTRQRKRQWKRQREGHGQNRGTDQRNANPNRSTKPRRNRAGENGGSEGVEEPHIKQPSPHAAHAAKYRRRTPAYPVFLSARIRTTARDTTRPEIPPDRLRCQPRRGIRTNAPCRAVGEGESRSDREAVLHRDDRRRVKGDVIHRTTSHRTDTNRSERRSPRYPPRLRAQAPSFTA